MYYDRLSIGAIVLGTLLVITITAPGIGAPDPAPADSLGTRPLRSLMTELGQDMNKVSEGIWREDFQMIAAGAERVAHHPRVPAQERMLIQEILTDRFPQFVALDQTVHRTALELTAAAQARNLTAVLDQADRLARACVACHTAFRDPVRQAFWQDALSKSAANGND